MEPIDSPKHDSSLPFPKDDEQNLETLLDDPSAVSAPSKTDRAGFSIPTFLDNQFSHRDIADYGSQSPSAHNLLPNDFPDASEPETERSRALSEPKSLQTVEGLGYSEGDNYFQSLNQRTTEILDDHSSRDDGFPRSDNDTLLQHVGTAEALSRSPNPSDKSKSVNKKPEPLGRIIRKSKKISAHEEQEFLPISELNSIITDENIRHTQKTTCPNIIEEDLKKISQEVRKNVGSIGRRRIYAILALIGKTAYMADFISECVDDSMLPLEFHWIAGNFEVFKSGHQTHITLFDSWSDPDCEAFRNNQASMLAPVFRPPKDKIGFQKIPRNSVLPFLEYEKKDEGGYGNVFKVKIHPSHHTFGQSEYFNDQNPYFAVKTLRLQGREDLEHEVEALNKLSSVAKPHPHLVRLLLAYQHGENYHLLFHWANGNLQQYWERNKRPSPTTEIAHWFVDQCVGLAGGLRKIHRIHTGSWNANKTYSTVCDIHGKNRGRHGDLKPENILCFEKDGKVQLVISDFGFSRYHTQESQSKEPYDKLPGWTGTYRPPECDMKLDISQRYDTWTLGCVFLIFVSWLVLGYETGVQEFAKERVRDDIFIYPQLYAEDKFFNLVNGVPKIKESVQNWILKIRATENRPLFVDRFLNLIMEGLLVPNSRHRWNSDHICAELKQIQMEFQKNTDSCLKQVVHPPKMDSRLHGRIVGNLEGATNLSKSTEFGNTTSSYDLEDSVMRNSMSSTSGSQQYRHSVTVDSSSHYTNSDEFLSKTNNIRGHSNLQKDSGINIMRPRLAAIQDSTCSSSVSDGDGRTVDTTITTPIMTNEDTEAFLKDLNDLEIFEKPVKNAHLAKAMVQSVQSDHVSDEPSGDIIDTKQSLEIDKAAMNSEGINQEATQNKPGAGMLYIGILLVIVILLDKFGGKS